MLHVANPVLVTHKETNFLMFFYRDKIEVYMDGKSL